MARLVVQPTVLRLDVGRLQRVRSGPGAIVQPRVQFRRVPGVDHCDAGSVAFGVREVHDLVRCEREARRPTLDEREAAEHVVGCDARQGVGSAPITKPSDGPNVLARRHLEAEQALF